MIDAHLLTASGNRRPVQQLGVTLEIRGSKMQMGPNGPTATHRRHSWEIDGERFLVMRIDSRVTVRVEGGGTSRTMGPFDELWLVDGMILSDLDQENGLAEFDESQKLWVCPADGSVWESIVFTEA